MHSADQAELPGGNHTLLHCSRDGIIDKVRLRIHGVLDTETAIAFILDHESFVAITTREGIVATTTKEGILIDITTRHLGLNHDLSRKIRIEISTGLRERDRR